MLTLKRGSGRSFDGSNWKLVKDSKWEILRLYVANGKEELLGERMIDGVLHTVFKCLDDTLFAQPKDVCEKPVPEDPMEVIYELDTPDTEVEEQPKKKQIPLHKMMSFHGTNWKLAKDAKWKQMAGFITLDEKDHVGERNIGQSLFKVYKTPTGFLAVKQEPIPS